MTAKRRDPRAAVVLPTVLVVMLTICLVTALVARFSIRSMVVGRRTLDVQRAFVSAEACLGFGVMRVRNMLVAQGIDGFLSSYTTIGAPDPPDSDYQLFLKIVPLGGTNSTGTITSKRQDVAIYAGARNPTTGVNCALKQVVRADGTSLGEYAAFYEGDLEANVGKQLTFVGKVHTNGDLYLGKNVTFERNLTCVGNFHNYRKNTGKAEKPYNVQIRKGDDENYSASDKARNPLVNTHVAATEDQPEHFVDSDLGAGWIAQSALYYGGAVRTGENGVTRLSPPISVEDDDHDLIEPKIPDTQENRDSGLYKKNTEDQKFATKAAITIHVNSDGTYNVKDFNGNDLTSRLKTAELYSPGYWRGTYGNSTNIVTRPGWWWNLQGKLGYCDKPKNPLTGEVVGEWEWVSEYKTQPTAKPESLLGFPDIASWQAGKSWTATPTLSEWDDVDAATAWTGYAHRTFYAKNPDTGAYYFKTPGAIQTCNTFLDQRQNFVEKATDIYVDQLIEAFGAELDAATGAEDGPDKIVYIEMDTPDPIQTKRYNVEYYEEDDVLKPRPTTVADECYSQVVPEAVVRLRNASDLKGKDLSIVTARPVFVEGNFNTKGLSVNDWNKSGAKPDCSALIAGDRISMLSNNWQDFRSMANVAAWGSKKANNVWNPDETLRQLTGKEAVDKGNLDGVKRWMYAMTQRPGVNTMMNCVALTGVLPTGAQNNAYSGGLENIFRFIEDWNNKNFYFNGSIICLWNTEDRDRWWQEVGNYYRAPTRQWAWHPMNPPGIPHLFSVREISWDRVAWSRVDWDGSGGDDGD